MAANGYASAAAPAAAPGIEMAPGSRKVTGAEVAKTFRAEVKTQVGNLDRAAPKLVAFLSNADPAARKYAEWAAKTFEAESLRFELREVPEEKLEEQLDHANRDPGVHGIMIYYPIFGTRPSFHGGSHDDYLRDSVSAYKDVEGLGHYYRHALYRNKRVFDDQHPASKVLEERKCVLPCTPLACLKTLEYLSVYDNQLPVGNRMSGKKVTVVNRSEVVGRPLAAMLANDGAEVYSVDIDSLYIFRRGKLELPPAELTVELAVRTSDVVILGVPSEKYKMDPSWIKEGAVVINVASHKNIDDKLLLSTRPGVRFMGAVGAVTVSMLERNLMRLYSNFQQEVAEGKPGQASIF